MTLVLVHTHEEPPDEWDAAVFLAGPTPRSPEVPSWRPEAVELLRAGWSGGRLVVFVPEDPEGGMRGGWDEQVAWEDRELNRADVIAFWVPRDLTTLPGFTTNVEFGRWHDSGKAVLGAPPDAPGTRYLRRYAPGPVAGTLPDTVAVALRHVASPARRAGAERDVPLHLWHRPEFQRWYAGLRAAGDELRAARPATSAPGFVWTLPVEVWIRAEDRVQGKSWSSARTRSPSCCTAGPRWSWCGSTGRPAGTCVNCPGEAGRVTRSRRRWPRSARRPA